MHVFVFCMFKKEWSCVENLRSSNILWLPMNVHNIAMNRICKENMKGIVWSYLCKLNIVSLWLLCMCVFVLNFVLTNLYWSFYDIFNHLHVFLQKNSYIFMKIITAINSYFDDIFTFIIQICYWNKYKLSLFKISISILGNQTNFNNIFT